MSLQPEARGGRSLSAIVLAAGLSQRMGRENKLLLSVGGQPLARRVAATVASYPFVEIVVVTGHERAEVEAILRDLPVRFAHNERYEEGQMTSVRAGLAALAAESEGVMVCLGDQPALTAEDIAFVADGFFARAPLEVLVPTFGGARGNPIVLSRSSLEAILARGGSFGCKQFVAKNADLVTTVEMTNDHVLIDVDRPEDLRTLPALA